MTRTTRHTRPSFGRSLHASGLAPLLLAGLTLLALQARLASQIRDEVRIFADDSANGYAESLVRFSRKLVPVGATSVKGLGGTLGSATPMTLDALGRSWIAFDPLNTTKLLRTDKDGLLLSGAQLAHNPVNVVVDDTGHAYASTRIGLLAPGPAYGVNSDGSVQWSNMSGPALFSFTYPQHLAVTSTGELWLGGWTAPSGPAEPLMVRLNKTNGAVTGTLGLPGEAGVCSFGPSGDGSLWAFVCGGSYRWLHKTQGTQVLDSFPINGGYSGISYVVHVDALDRPHVLSLESAGWNTKVYRYDPAAPESPDAAYQLGGKVSNWGFGASGEEIFAIVWPESDPFARRLERLVLHTGAKSSVPLNPVWPDAEMTRGDHTGWVYANVVDQNGDNDGDGASNRTETLAASNPFDPLSRPEGPKVYLSFAPTTNAIVLTYVDPDGLLDPAGGLDLSSLQLLTGAGTNVWAFILPFLTTVDVTSDLTHATATFGLLPLPSDLKIRLEARVTDLTGAEGWDWQVTPPGDL